MQQEDLIEQINEAIGRKIQELAEQCTTVKDENKKNTITGEIIGLKSALTIIEYKNTKY